MVLETRLRGRGTEKEEDIQKRLAYAEVDLEYAGACSNIIINEDFERAYEN